MDIKDIIAQLQAKFGNSFDVSQVTKALQGMDLSKLNFTQVTGLLANKGLLGDLDGDGKVESPIEELKGVAAKMFGDKLGGIFGK